MKVVVYYRDGDEGIYENVWITRASHETHYVIEIHGGTTIRIPWDAIETVREEKRP